jgi:hypothetical protein
MATGYGIQELALEAVVSLGIKTYLFAGKRGMSLSAIELKGVT